VQGSGPAGQRAAIYGAKLGKRVAVVEERVVGSACIHTGTIPSKTMREAVLHLCGYNYKSIYGMNCRVKEKITASRPAAAHSLRSANNSSRLFLARWAKVRSTPGKLDALDLRTAHAAGLASALVDLMPQLKESAHPISINVIGDRGTTQFDRLLQHRDKRRTQLLQFIERQSRSLAGRPDARAKQRLIGIDVADTMQQ
jgi:hypothetical protein